MFFVAYLQLSQLVKQCWLVHLLLELEDCVSMDLVSQTKWEPSIEPRKYIMTLCDQTFSDFCFN